MAGDLPDWVRQVQVVGGSVTIAGTATVTISGTPSVTVASGSVAINNTPSVTVASGSVAISNTPSVTIASGTVTATVSGNVTITSGTVTVTEVEQNVVVDNLGTASITPTAPPGGTVHNYGAALHQYTGLLVYVPEGIAAYAYNSTKNVQSPTLTAADRTGTGATSSPLWLPCPFDTGDTVEVGVIIAPLNAALSVQVFGLGEFPANVPRLRADGRLTVAGNRAAASRFTAAGTLVAAPGANLRLLLKSLTLGGGIIGSGGSIATVQGVFRGATLDLASASCSANGGGQGTALDFGDGLLLDVNTAVTVLPLVGTPTQPYVATAVYDIVV